jgi:K(+)-stimulated pyrophosphate-energized sodium pump
MVSGEAFSTENMTIVLETLAGFSLGAESIALFARVGGGIYTKAADVGADLVGKVEAGIPEDDPRNPATIADNVGDNVGDVAGMGADLFGSYVATVLAAMVLGNYVIRDNGAVEAFDGLGPILLPMAIAGVGIIISMLGSMLVKIKSNDAKEKEVMGALNVGNWFSIFLVAILCYFLVDWMLPESMTMKFFGEAEREISSIRVFAATIIGLIVGAVISSVTEYYTGLGKKTNFKNCTTIEHWSWNKYHCWFSYRDDFYFSYCHPFCSSDLGIVCICGVLRSSNGRFSHDGYNSDAVGY